MNIYMYTHTYIYMSRSSSSRWPMKRSKASGLGKPRYAVFAAYLGVSENRGTLFWGPYEKDPTI